MSGKLSRRSLLRGAAVAVAGLSAWTAAAGTRLRLRPAEGLIRLRANENPYGPSDEALAAASRASAQGAYYPGPIEEDLLGLIAARHGLAMENVLLASGSNEALCAAAVAFGKSGTLVVPGLTYTPHLRYATGLGVRTVDVPLREDMGIDLPAMERAARDAAMVYVCNPNNPTGMTVPGDVLRRFCRAVGPQAVVLVDEAYNELTDDPEATSMVDLVRAGENVIVTRTFSKIHGMAGMRIGYVMAPSRLAAVVRNQVMSWPNVVGIAAAIASYQDQAFVEFSRRKIIEGRGIVEDTFRRHGIEPLPSQANFVYADIGRDADRFAARMREAGVDIRDAYPPYSTWSRVSTGKLEDLEVFSRVFDRVYRSG